MRSKFKWIFSLLLALSMQFVFAQEKTITGTVSDESGYFTTLGVMRWPSKEETMPVKSEEDLVI